jgi:uncharacterized membrane protein YkoI
LSQPFKREVRQLPKYLASIEAKESKMSLTAKLMRKSSLLGALVLATALSAQAAHATATPVEATAALQAATITKQRAEAIALQAVGGGTVVLAVLEREDAVIHWSVDITGSTEEYEVWVSTRGKVLRIIAQPL